MLGFFIKITRGTFGFEKKIHLKKKLAPKVFEEFFKNYHE
jgi:hypothetical protein